MTATLTSIPTWIRGAFYAKGDFAKFDGRKFECIADTNGTTPPPDDKDHWRGESGILFLIGSASIWTPQQLNAMSTVGPGDYPPANALWRDLAGPAWAGVLGFGGLWDPQRQTYGEASSADLKRASLGFAAAVAADLALEAEAMIAADVAIHAWQAATARTVKLGHLAMGAFAVGGFNRLTPADLTKIGGELRYSLRKLRRFARATENGDARAGSEDAIRYRAKLYGDKLNTLYELIRNDSHRRATGGDGVALFTAEKNILADSEHCTDHDDPPFPGCLEEAERGWVPIGTLSLPGTRACAMKCKCRMVYRGDVSEN